MSIYIRNWARKWQVLIYDVNNSSGRFSFSSIWKKKKISGWGFRYQKIWYILRADSGKLFFHAGVKIYELSANFHCTNSLLNNCDRIFTIIESERTVFDLRYSELVDSDDPTSDSLDLELQDFFYYVCLVWNDFSLKRDLVRLWCGN